MEIDLKTCSVLICDNGLFVPLAECLTKWFGWVGYFSPFAGAFPRHAESAIGTGIKGVERVYDLWGCIDKLDKEKTLVVFPDLLWAGECEHLRALGYRVWGSGNAEKLELDRKWAKEEFMRLGIPVAPYATMTGTEALKNYLKSRTKPVYVKGRYARHRADLETHRVDDFKLSEGWFNELEAKLGRGKDSVEIVVEDEIPDAIEIGTNRHCTHGQFPLLADIALECKGDCLVSHYLNREDFPPELHTADHILMTRPWAKDYVNWFTNESRVTKDGISYPIDPCMRAGRPHLGSIMANVTNLGPLMWAAAAGELIEPEIEDAWTCELMIECPTVEKRGCVLIYPESISDRVFLSDSFIDHGLRKVLAHDISNIGSVVGLGSSLKAACEDAKKLADQVKGDGIEIHTESLDKAKSQIEEASEYGIEFDP